MTKAINSFTNNLQFSIARLRNGRNVGMNYDNNNHNANDKVEVFEQRICCQGFCTRKCLCMTILKVFVGA